MILYRLAANIPVPGINREVLKSIATGGGAGSNLFNLLDLLSGGTVSNFSILAMGVYPYITAQIILQLLIPIIPALERKMKENPREGHRIGWKNGPSSSPSRWLCYPRLDRSISLAHSLVVNRFCNVYGFTGSALLPTLTTLFSMVGGTMLGIWLGQLISEYGIRNQGLSLIIFAGIVARIPSQSCIAAWLIKQWLVVDLHRLDHPRSDHLRDRLCSARPPECSGDVPWTPGG